MDDDLTALARARLLQARPDVDDRRIAAYLDGKAFDLLQTFFGKQLLKQLDTFIARDDAAASAAGVDPAPRLPATPPGAEPATAPTPIPPAATASVPTEAQAPQGSRAIAESPPASAGDVPAATDRPIPAAPPTLAALPPPDLMDAVLRLPNARAGNDYAQRIEPADSGEAIVFDDIVVPDGLPLAADPATGAVAGTPPDAGEYLLRVTYHFARESTVRRRLATVPLVVAPDPRTMWKNLPSDRDAPYWKDDERRDTLRGADLSIVAASKRGRSHAHVAGFRDDDYRIGQVEDTGWSVAVVADGAGSARYSRRGAQIICDEAGARVLAALAGDTVARLDQAAHALAHAADGIDGAAPDKAAAHDALHAHLSRIVGNAAYWAVKAIHDEVAQRPDLGATFKDYASTALIAACKRYPFGTLCAAYWVGDGAVGVFSERDGVTLLGDVDSGEFSGQTRFLDNTMVDQESLRRRTRIALAPDMTALVLMTDGVSDAMFETEARLHRADDWRAFWRGLDAAVGFGNDGGQDSDGGDGKDRRLLDWLDFWSPGNHDDRTIAVIF